MANEHKRLRASLDDQIKSLESGNPPSSDAGLFGFSIDPADSQLVIIPVPWDATTSYGGGTCHAPSKIIPASHQLDLEDLGFGTPYKSGITLLDIPEEIFQLSKAMRNKASSLREMRQSKDASQSAVDSLLNEINLASKQVNHFVETTSQKWLSEGKKVAVLGGDHSSPYGLMRALGDHHKEFGVLHVDAHFDLRQHYEGFIFSHASIMYNVMQNITSVKHLSQIGIRDFSKDEHQYQKDMASRSSVMFSRDIGFRKAIGTNWAQIVDETLRPLPEMVYISFDIDGLDPALCPSTGTPVPGGLLYEEAMYLLEAIGRSGRKVIGFDLCEVTPNDNSEWDANVGSRILYKLCGAALQH